MATFPAFFDTNALFGFHLNDVFLAFAERGAFRPLWSADVLEELRRNLNEHGIDSGRVERRIAAMIHSFPDATVTGYEDLVTTMTCDPKDRHVLAAAVRANAEVLVTFKLKDFPAASVADTIDRIHVPRRGHGRPRTRPDRVLADKGYPSRANRAYLAARGIKATIPDRADQKQNRANKGSVGGRPTMFDAEFHKGRNVVERSFNRLKNWRGIAMRSDKTARNYQAGVTLAAALIWINTD